jgi:inorganic pyrophosphatase
MPGTTNAIREWFRNYKVPDGKPQNSFALDERVMNRDYALKVIQETHVAWQKLCAGQVAGHKLWIPQSKPSL